MRWAGVVLALALAAPARAEIQSSGKQVWPGKVQVGAHPIGFQVGWSGNEASGYKLNADLAVLIADVQNLTLWFGGGVNYVAGFFRCLGCGHDLQVWAFVELSFEKLIDFPIVPFVRVGPGGDVLIYRDFGGAFIMRFGGGAHYWILRNIGLGAETYFTAGAGFYGGTLGTLLYGAWDFTLGARFAF